ncbi:hypothetical protein NLJ89_g6815 [Agrocybe chaxingu]|uniref:Spen paralogue and orthologue SPOC C-terminal domain-containing protein n=1 Tax=Agrocybe chaxingu TaxID=84603 RepID=A0A9W8JYF4_9AGAR|nr:hypothetical protein NLJ89_g6815 [Agrocybe chaxingu]
MRTSSRASFLRRVRRSHRLWWLHLLAYHRSPSDKRAAAPSFDLNALWNAPKEVPPPTNEEASPAAASDTTDTAVFTTTPLDQPRSEDSDDKDDAMELESVEANDQDFDMFLDEKPHEPTLIVSNIQRPVESLPQVWSGKITMPLDSSVPQETTLIARQVGGKPLAPDSVLWSTLFPSDVLRIEGRVPVENSVKYLLQMRMNPTKELYAAAFVPASSEGEADFKVFCNFLISKSRHGLVLPWGSRPKEYHPGRELYMIPLLQTEALPEFVELLDDLKLPKARSRDFLVGIWILNKGKLAPLPGHAQTTPPVQTPTPTQSTPTPQPPAPALNIPVFNPPPVAPLSATPNAPPPIPNLPIAPSTLAAEVASLTPEQIQSVLRTLAATNLPGLAPPAPAPAPPPQSFPPIPPPLNRPPFPPHMPPQTTAPPPPNSQPWMPPPGPYPINFPPPNVPFQQPTVPPQTTHHSPPPLSNGAYDRKDYDRRDYERQDYDRQDYNRQDYDRDYRPGPPHQQGRDDHYGGQRDNRGPRGQNSNRGNKNRNRGGRNDQGHDRDFQPRRSADSGWPRRPRNDHQGGPGW